MGRTRNRSLCAVLVAMGGVAAALLMGPAPATAAGSVAGTVSAVKGGLAVRAGASSYTAKVGNLKHNTKINIACQVSGQYVKGRVRKTDKWDRLTNGQYVSDAFVKRSSRTAIKACPPPAPAPTAATAVTTSSTMVAPEINGSLIAGDWVVPVPKIAIGGFRTVSRPEHDGVDLSWGRNTPIRSIAAGTVVTVRCNTSGPSCDVDGSTTTSGCGWYTEIRHVGDVVSRYCHMVRQPEFPVGTVVAKGQIIGYVGTSGHSSGPHLHFEVHLGYPATRANAVDPVKFMAAAGAPLN
jgi:murein DD-endopeptidase MepM/ murein hydrolase activator NlpD